MAWGGVFGAGSYPVPTPRRFPSFPLLQVPTAAIPATRVRREGQMERAGRPFWGRVSMKARAHPLPPPFQVPAAAAAVPSTRRLPPAAAGRVPAAALVLWRPPPRPGRAARQGRRPPRLPARVHVLLPVLRDVHGVKRGGGRARILVWRVAATPRSAARSPSLSPPSPSLLPLIINRCPRARGP